MLDRTNQRPDQPPQRSRAPADFQEHLARLDAAGLLVRIDREVNKDTELHPLVRWQFQGGLDEDERRAFLFTNVVDSQGRRYDIPVLVGGLAASPEIYALGTATTGVSFVVIAIALGAIAILRARQTRHGSDAGQA